MTPYTIKKQAERNIFFGCMYVIKLLKKKRREASSMEIEMGDKMGRSMGGKLLIIF